MKTTDYLLMKGGAEVSAANDPAGQISTRRIVLSFVGLLAGIFLSFLISGIEKIPAQANTQGESITAPVENSRVVDTQRKEGEPSEVTISWPGLKEAVSLFIITLVICMLSYQSLYASLKLYSNEPTFLVLFVAFQYGFFWQSVVKGVGTIL